VVLGGNDNTEEDELKDDLLSIVNVFVARRNGKRAQRLRKLRKESQKISQSSDENKIVSHISPEDPLEDSI
jgi:predicted site-specific integrase-resolvase